ncbi:hypothetical protein T439DRAFT_380918 [Meredithblackwellia eburnea MCA 4105]
MAPLSKAIQTKLAWIQHDGTHVYKGAVDPAWCIGNVPQGGYMLSIILYSAIAYQSLEPHNTQPDPAHASAQYLSASTGGAPVQVRIKLVSRSKRWTRLDASLVQDDSDGKEVERIRAHLLFTSLNGPGEPRAPSSGDTTVLPNSVSPFAKICPITEHPSKCAVTKMFGGFDMNKHVCWSEGTGRGSMVEGGGKTKLDWGGWWEMTDEEEDVTQSAALLPFFSDMFRNGPECLPKDQSPGPSWYPTLTLALDFKSRFPLAPVRASPTSKKSTPIAKRTVGLYSISQFIHEGRHDETVEVWTAPCAIGDKNAPEVGSEEWRKGAQILCVSTQVGLVLPYEVNARKAKPKAANL